MDTDKLSDVILSLGAGEIEFADMRTWILIH